MQIYMIRTSNENNKVLWVFIIVFWIRHIKFYAPNGLAQSSLQGNKIENKIRKQRKHRRKIITFFKNFNEDLKKLVFCNILLLWISSTDCIVIEFSKVSVGLLFTGKDAKQIFDIKTR